jgi:hypothetical protein
MLANNVIEISFDHPSQFPFRRGLLVMNARADLRPALQVFTFCI